MHKPKNIIDSSEYSRKIKNMGEFRREQERLEYEAKKKIALTSSRPIDTDINLREIGRLRIQILYCSSFEPWFMWDVREKWEDKKQIFEVYENSLESLSTISPGYMKLPVEETMIRNLIYEINQTKISLQLDSSSNYGLDGTVYGLTVFNSLNREIKLRWWSEPPDELVSLNDIIVNVIDIFKGMDGKVNVV